MDLGYKLDYHDCSLRSMKIWKICCLYCLQKIHCWKSISQNHFDISWFFLSKAEWQITYPPPMLICEVSPDIKRWAVGGVFSPSAMPTHGYRTRDGAKVHTKLSPVPKYFKLRCWLRRSAQSTEQYAPIVLKVQKSLVWQTSFLPEDYD